MRFLCMSIMALSFVGGAYANEEEVTEVTEVTTEVTTEEVADAGSEVEVAESTEVATEEAAD